MALAITNEEAQKLLSMEDCIVALELAYKELGEGVAVNRPRTDIHVSTSVPQQIFRFKTMEGVIPGLGVTALRVNSDIVSWPVIDGKQRQVKVMSAPGQTQCAFIILFKNDTGEPLAIIQDSFIQRMRVGASNGLAAKYLAREDAQTVGLIGSGWQAGAQLMACAAVRGIKSVKVYSQNPQHRTEFAREMGNLLGVEILPVGSGEEAMREVDIVVAATNSMVPVLFEEMLVPGVHVSAIKRFEVDEGVFRSSDVIVLNTKHGKGLNYSSTNAPIEEIPYMNGDSFNIEDMEHYPELSELVTGKHRGRKSREEITFFMNNVGIGIQFTATAFTVYQRAMECGIGTVFPSEIFLQTWHS